MRKRTILGLTALGLVAACAHPAPDPLAGMDWRFSHTPEEGEKLAFGAAQSDHLVVMLTCQPGSGEVVVAAVTPRPGPLGLRSGQASASLQGESMPGMTPDAVWTEASAAADHPVMAAFAATGRLELTAGGATTRLPAGSQAAIGQFFAGCRAV